VTTTTVEEAREGSSPADPQEPDSTAQSGACARESITRTTPASLRAVTQRVRLAGQVTAVRLGLLLDKPGTLVHSQPPTFRQARDRHHECAGHFGTPALSGLRLLWGYVHLLVILPPLYLLAWVTESPLRLFIAAALVTAIWFFR
jgi:hypothetical protein